MTPLLLLLIPAVAVAVGFALWAQLERWLHDAVGVAPGQEAAPLATRKEGPDESVSQPSSPLPRRPS